MLPDRATLDTFVDAIFRHADEGTFISIRAFDDDRRGDEPIFIDGIKVGDARFGDWMFNRAKHAASHNKRACFCPPCATFTDQRKASEAVLANGLTILVECDKQPNKSLQALSAILGHPTVITASGGEWVDPDTGEVQDRLHLHWRLSEPTRGEEEHAALKEARSLACTLVDADTTAVTIVHPIRWPGSVHRKGVPRLARIVEQTENEIELADALGKLRLAVPPEMRKAQPGNGSLAQVLNEGSLQGDLLDITAALAVIPNGDLPWDEWTRIMMATWAASSGEGFQAFLAWSRRSQKHDDGITATRWAHVAKHPPEKIGAGTLYFMAKEAMPGWTKPTSYARRLRADQPEAEEAAPEHKPEGAPANLKPAMPRKPADKTEKTTVSYQGLLVPTMRDRLEIALKIDPAPAFPVRSLPPLMQDMIAALVEHVQAPESLCAHSVIGAAALVCQGLADILIPSLARAIPISIFMLVIAASGERKSSCDGIAQQAVSDLEAELRETYAEDLREFKAEKAAYDGEVAKIKSDKKIEKAERIQQLRVLVEPLESTSPTLRAEEPNLEGLLNLLVRGRPSLGLFTAEGGSFLGGHGMNEDAKIRTITGLSRLYDAGSAQRVRAKELTYINGRRVSISLAVQPRIAATLLGDDMARDQGFVGRFLVCMPDSTIGTREVRITNPSHDDRIKAFYRRVEHLLRLQESEVGELKLPALTLDPVAWEVWRSIAQAIENELGEKGIWYPVRATAQRTPENIARLAGILHVFCEGHTDQPVSGNTMAIACDVGLFYLKEALRLTGTVVADSETMAADDLAKWLAGRSTDFVSPSIIQQTAPNHLRSNAKLIRSRVESLCSAGVLELLGPGDIDGKTYREVYRFQRGGKH